MSRESVNHFRLAMGDMVKWMVAESYLMSNIAEGLKTPKAAKRSDRSLLRRRNAGRVLARVERY